MLVGFLKMNELFRDLLSDELWGGQGVKRTAYISKRFPFIEDIKPLRGILRSRRDIYAMSVSTAAASLPLQYSLLK